MGRPFRILTVVDNWSRHSPILEAEFRMTGDRWSVTRSGPGHTSSVLLDHGGSWDGIPITSLGGLGLSAGSPTRLHSTGQTRGECLHRSVNGRLRDECLNVHQFASHAEAQAIIEAWLCDYNQRRPDSSLGHLTRMSLSANVRRRGLDRESR